MARPSKTDQELGAMRDFWNEVRTLEADHHGMFTMLVSPVGRPGIFKFTMVFTPLMEGQPNGLSSHSMEFTFPNVEESALAGMLWRKSIRLGWMVREAAEKRAHDRKPGG